MFRWFLVSYNPRILAYAERGKESKLFNVAALCERLKSGSWRWELSHSLQNEGRACGVEPLFDLAADRAELEIKNRVLSELKSGE